MVLVCSKLGLMINLLVTTCSWQALWQRLLDLLVLLMLHCNQICLKIKMWCNHRLYAANGKIYTQSSDTDKKITDYINSMRGVGAWRVLKGDAVN